MINILSSTAKHFRDYRLSHHSYCSCLCILDQMRIAELSCSASDIVILVAIKISTETWKVTFSLRADFICNYESLLWYRPLIFNKHVEESILTFSWSNLLTVFASYLSIFILRLKWVEWEKTTSIQIKDAKKRKQIGFREVCQTSIARSAC